MVAFASTESACFVELELELVAAGVVDGGVVGEVA